MNINARITEGLPEDAAMIRRKVFMEEQGFEDEFDETDATAWHIVLYQNAEPVATGRAFPSREDSSIWILGRIAVLKEYRKLHLGREIIAGLEQTARQGRAIKTALSAQIQARPFYEKNGYIASGAVYYDESCPHIHMEKTL